MDNPAPQRKRAGRPPSKMSPSSEQPTDVHACAASVDEEVESPGISPSLMCGDVENSNASSSPLHDSSTATIASGGECRRSSRKKIIKFDVRDLLNKNRKPHKIQIEARIDSNAPTPPPLQTVSTSNLRQTVGSTSVGGTTAVLALTPSTTPAELTSKQKTFIEKSAIFRRFSISAEQQTKMSAALRPPFPSVTNKAAHEMQIQVDTAKIAQARRLSRTQEIFNASMMKSKQNSSLIIAQMESSSCSSIKNSPLIAQQRRMTLCAAVPESSKRKGTATKTAIRGTRQPNYIEKLSAPPSSAPTTVQKKRGRPPKNKNANSHAVNIVGSTPSTSDDTLRQNSTKVSTKESQLTPEKAKNWREYKACVKSREELSRQATVSSKAVIDAEVLEISSSSESESDSIQSPGSNESFTLNEPTTSKRRSKQRNFAAVSFMQEITSKLSENVSAPEFIVASVDEIHSEPLTPCNSMSNLHVNRGMESSNQIIEDVQPQTDVTQVRNPMELETRVEMDCPGELEEMNDTLVNENEPQEKRYETPIRRKASTSSSASESNSEKNQSKSYRRGDKLRVSLKRLSAQDLSLSSTSSTSAPSSPSSAGGNESSSIKEDSSDRLKEHKKAHRKRSKRLLQLELEKATITDCSSSFEETDATTKKKRKMIRRFNLGQEIEETVLAEEKLGKVKATTIHDVEKKIVSETVDKSVSNPESIKKVEKDSESPKKELQEQIISLRVGKKFEESENKKILETELVEKQDKAGADADKYFAEKPVDIISDDHSSTLEKNNETEETQYEKSSNAYQLCDNKAVGKENENYTEKNTTKITSTDGPEDETQERRAKDESYFDISQGVENPPDKDTTNINAIKEVESESQDEIEKLNREIENEIAKEIKDLINKDIEKESKNETECIINSMNIEQFQAAEIDSKNTNESIAEEQSVCQKESKRGNTTKVTQGEEKNALTSTLKETNQTNNCEVQATKSDDLTEQKNATLSQEKSKNNREASLSDNKIDCHEQIKRRLRSATPPENKSKEKATTPSTSPTHNLCSNEQHAKELSNVAQCEILTSSPTAMGDCEGKSLDKLLSETATETPSSSTNLKFLKSLPKSKEVIQLPQNKLSEEPHINVVHDNLGNVDAEIRPYNTIIAPQVTELVDVETKTLLDILKTVQSNETACVTPECLDEFGKVQKTKVSDSPPKSPKSPKSPIERCRKPGTAVRRYERRSKRGGEEGTLHKTLEETFAEIAAQSSKAILEMYSNRVAVEEGQDENKGATKVKTPKETHADLKEITLGRTLEDASVETCTESSDEIAQKNPDEIEKQIPENKMAEKVTNVEERGTSIAEIILETPKHSAQQVDKTISKDVIHTKVSLNENETTNNEELKIITKEENKPKDSNKITVKQKSVEFDIKEKLHQYSIEVDVANLTKSNDNSSLNINTTSADKMDVVKCHPLGVSNVIKEPHHCDEKQTENFKMPQEKINSEVESNVAEVLPSEKPYAEDKAKRVEEEVTYDKSQTHNVKITERRSEIEKSELSSEPEKSPLTPDKKSQPMCEDEDMRQEEILIDKQIKSIDHVITDNIETNELQTSSVDDIKFNHRKEIEIEMKSYSSEEGLEKDKTENTTFEAISQVESNSSTPVKRGRKPKTKEKGNFGVPLELKRSAGSRKAFYGEESCTSEEIDNTLEENSNICETALGSGESFENQDISCAKTTEVNITLLDATKGSEIEVGTKQTTQDMALTPKSSTENLNISNEMQVDKSSGDNTGAPQENTELNMVTDYLGQKQHFSITSDTTRNNSDEKSIVLADNRSKSPNDQQKGVQRITEKSSTEKVDEQIISKSSQGAGKKKEKSKEKSKFQLETSTTSSLTADKIVPKSTVNSGEIESTKPPPKKRYLKAHLEQAGQLKDDVSIIGQEKHLLIESNPYKKCRKPLPKITSVTKEKQFPAVGLSSLSKQASKSKQKHSVTPINEMSVPTQSSSKKKSKKLSEESEQSVAVNSKIVEKKISKKIETKKFLETEQDADGRTVALDEKTSKKKRQRKLKEAFEAALKEVAKNKDKEVSALASVATTSTIATSLAPTSISVLPIEPNIQPLRGITSFISSELTTSLAETVTPMKVGNSPTNSTQNEVENNSSILKEAIGEELTADKSWKHVHHETTFSPERKTESPQYNMPLTPTNFELRTIPLTDISKSIEIMPPLKEIVTTVVQQEEDPDDPLKDIEKFIEDGVNLLKRGYKIDNDEDDSVDGVVLNVAKKLVKEDLLSTPLKNRDFEDQRDLASLTSFAETPADTPIATPSATPPPKSPCEPETPPPLSDDSFTTSGGVRRSHRIKQNSKTPKALVGRGLVREKERVSVKDDVETKTHYTIDDHRMDLAEVEAKNTKFLKDMEERLSNFRVIKENEYKCERIVSKEAKKMICDCFLTAEEEERGELGCGEDCLNRLLMIECGPDCNVKERCTNKRFQKFLSSPCRVFRTEKKGFGIMADIEILPGEFIMEYVGEVINGDEFERRRIVYSLDKNRHYYFMALRSDAIIDATSKGNISRFINHSCDPNAETQKWTVNGELRIGFFSRKSIMPGEEITFDYQYQRYGREAQRCYCESSNCRGWIGEEPNSDEGEQIDDDSDGDEEDENLAESLLAEDDDDDDSDETDADADAEEAQKKLEKAAAEAKLTPMMEDEQKKQLLETTGMGDDKRKKSESGALDSSKEEDSKSKFKKLLSKMAEKVAKKKDKKERRRKQRTQRDEGGASIKPIKQRFLEDPDIEDEVHFLSRCGLKNQSDTLRLSRLMVRAKLVQTRLNLLKILRSGELPCRRLFLDYHGLRLLHGWMSEDGGDLNIRLALLETLESLPIANKTVLKDSKVYQAVRNWCENGASSSGDSVRSQSVSPSDESSKESTSGPQVGPIQEIPSELRKLASKLTASWDSLPEIFRIPKRERIEQMKEHEREADRQYAAVAATRGEEDKRRSYSSYDRYQRDRFGRSGPYSSGGSNGSNRFTWSRGNGGNGKETRNPLVLGGIGSSGDPRRRGDSASHGSADGTKHLSKEQRREMFAAKVARDEAEKRLAEERREFETKCRFFGLDPKKTRPQNLPFCVNPSTGQWYSADRQPIPTPPSYAHVQVPVKPKSTNPADYQLPATTANLSHKWKFAITPQGKIYYYHVQYRIPQWEPPTHEQMYGNGAVQGGEGGATSNSESGSDGLTNESTDDDDELIKGMEPARLQAYVDQKIEMRRQQRYTRLVGERSISPRREEDRIYNQLEVRKYKENKEKIRKRKEEIRRRRIEAVHNSTLNMCTLGKLDEVLSNAADGNKSNKMEENDSVLPIQDYLLSSDEEETIKAECNNSPLIDKIVQGDKIVDELDALTSKRPLKRPLPTHRDISSSSRGLSGSSNSSSPGNYSSSSSSVDKHDQHKKRKLEKRELSKSVKKGKEQDSKYRKLKEKFRCEIAGIIVHHLKPYRKDACIIGRIQSNDDFNHLARKLTHFVMIKELKYCESVGQTLVVTESVKNKSREFIKKYMAKYGDVYIKPENDPDFKDIPFTLKI